jgi:hypothetical protein
MTIGPEPMIRIVSMSVRLGIEQILKRGARTTRKRNSAQSHAGGTHRPADTTQKWRDRRAMGADYRKKKGPG